MAEAGSVSALLKLDASGFDSSMTKSVEKITNFAKTMEKVGKNGDNFADGLKRVTSEINTLSTQLRKLDEISTFENFNRLSNAMQKMVNSVIRFNKEGGVTVTTFTQLGNGIRSFMNALGGVDIQLTNVVNAERMLITENNQVASSSSKAAQAVKAYDNALIDPAPSIFITTNEGVSFSLMSVNTAAISATTSLERFNIAVATSGTAGLTNVTHGVDNLNTSLRATQMATNLTSTNLSNVTHNMDKAGTSSNNLKNKVTETSNATKSMSSSFVSAGNNTNNFRNKVGGLTQSLNMLKGVVSMVGSMFLYNFAHNMMVSVQNTVKAKSEMLSFLHTMGMTGSQIDSFNAALDRTAERFQRINKYNIGETVANIGLEFDLSAQEMEKAMSVTSMVTSEYLRAGRNADEAALAVKDIMQGQFQRLSRETGVKGEQLKEAGWSGDTNDVLGLLDALEKVAKSRHWDTFAEKASSLNDIVLITQNRLSEWATDMSEGLVPIVTGAFNALVNIIDKVTGVFQSLSTQFHLPDWAGTAALIGAITAAIGGLVLATITWRTELGLLQIAQLGLKQSLVAAVFGIKAEELAEVNATTALKAKILGVQSETMAQMGTINILKAKVLGLDAETVAQEGVSAAIEKKLIDQRAEELQNAKNSASNISLLESYVSLKTGIEAADMEGLKWYQKLALLNRNTDELKVKNMNVIQSLKAFITSLNAARVATVALSTAIVALAAVAVAGYVAATMQGASVMKQFNELVDEGDEKIRKIKDVFGETSQQAKDMTEAVERARSAMSKFEERKILAQDKAGRAIGGYLKDLISDEEKLRDLSSTALTTSQAGVSQVAKTGDVIEGIWRRAANQVGFYGEKVKNLRGEDGLEEYVSETETRAERLATAYEKMTLSDSAIDRGFGWVDWTIENLGDFWSRFSVNLESHDWGAAWENVWKGFMDGFGHLPIASDIWNSIFNALNVDSFVKKGDLGGTLGNIGGALSDWILGGITDTIKNIPGMGDIMTLFGEAILGGQNAAKGLGDLDKWFTDALNSFDLGKIISDWWNQSDWSDFMDMGAYFNEHLIVPFMEWLSGADVWLTEMLQGFNAIDVGAIINSLVGGADGFITSFLNWFNALPIGDMFNQFINTFLMPLAELPMRIQGFLNNVFPVLLQFAGSLLTHGLTGGANFQNGLITHIAQIPSRVSSYLITTASNIVRDIGQWVINASSGSRNVNEAVIKVISKLPEAVYNEFMKIPERISSAISAAVSAATNFGSAIKDAVLGALHINSPGIIQNRIAEEFANIPGRISEQNANAESEATSFGQSIVNGMDSQMVNVQASADALTNAMNMTQADVVLDSSFVGDYQADANTIGGINQTMTTDTTLAFDTMGSIVNGTITGITTNVQSSYTAMNTNQTTALNTMQNNNRTAYTNLQNQTTTSLNNMRSTTQNVTVQMINAWNHMKDSIIASADQLKTQSTAHFNNLSDNIGSFYQKLQNPSMWGAGDRVPTRYYNSARGNRGIRAVRQTFGVSPSSGAAGGPSPDNLPQTMKLRQLRSLVGSPQMFRGMDMNQEVDVLQFLSMFGGAFGWEDWHPTHFEHIKSTTGEWDMRGPQIMHRIDTGMAFKVKEFYTSQPQISWGSFQQMAEALFSAIPYDFYWNSDKYGSWQAALQAGACNCWDGAHAILALANTCGFSGHIEHGTWNGLGHVYAVINGKKMDTTGWQQRRDWNGVAAGSPSNMKFGENKTVHINVDMTGATIIGEEDFRDKMEDIAHEVLRKEINTSVTVGI